MQVQNYILLRVVIFVLGVSGFFIARYIRRHKVAATPMICPIGFDCHSVVHSDYSKFLGMPVELLGMIYYAFISISYLFLIFSKTDPLFLVFPLAVISLGAFLFSFYLIIIQIFVLKKGCSWCIVSALICFLIAIFTGIYPLFLI